MTARLSASTSRAAGGVFPAQPPERGFTVIEFLLAFLVFTVGLLPMASTKSIRARWWKVILRRGGPPLRRPYSSIARKSRDSLVAWATGHRVEERRRGVRLPSTEAAPAAREVARAPAGGAQLALVPHRVRPLTRVPRAPVS